MVTDVTDVMGLDEMSALSRREREVMHCTSQGLTNAQIAAELGVTTHAVKFHLASIYRKLGVSNRTEATAQYVTARSSSHRVSQRS